MLSESARVTTAEEARYPDRLSELEAARDQGDRARPPSEAVVKRLAQGQWQRRASSRRSKFDGAPRGGEDWSMKAWLSDLAGRTKDLIDEVASADLMVMVASAGTKPRAAGVIAEACGVRKVMTTALIIGSEGVRRGALETLASCARMRRCW